MSSSPRTAQCGDQLPVGSLVKRVVEAVIQVDHVAQISDAQGQDSGDGTTRE